MNVLVVEDDVSVAQVIAESIEGYEHSVETAFTGRDALEKVRQKNFELVLLDIYLPDCMGYELIPQIKEVWPDIGIVTMTGYNSRELELNVRQQGIIYYMLKPFSMNEMKKLLDHISEKEAKGGQD